VRAGTHQSAQSFCAELFRCDWCGNNDVNCKGRKATPALKPAGFVG